MQEKGPPSDMDTSVVSGRSNASRHSVARLGGSLVHSSSTNGVRGFFLPLELSSYTLPANFFVKIFELCHLGVASINTKPNPI